MVLILSMSSLIGCSSDNSSGSSPYAGYWIDEDEISEGDDINNLGIQVTEFGQVLELTLDESKKGRTVGQIDGSIFKVSADYLKEVNEKNSEVQIQEVSASVKLENENKLVMSKFIFKGTYQGRDINESMQENSSESDNSTSYRRVTADEATQLLEERAAKIKAGEEVIGSLIGTTWELQEKYSKTDYIDSDDKDYEYTTKAEDMDSSFSYGEGDDKVTYYKFKKITFINENTLEINGGEFQSEYEYTPLFGLKAVNQSKHDYKDDFGVIVVDGDTMVITLDKVTTYIENYETDKEVRKKTHIIEKRTYQRVK